MVKPYIDDMNRSELLCLMTGGMATIAGGVFGAYANDSFERDYEQWVSAFRFAPGPRTRLVFHLHPGAIDYLESPDRLCLSAQSFGVPVCTEGEDPEQGCARPNRRRVTDPIYAVGGDLTGELTHPFAVAGPGEDLALHGATVASPSAAPRSRPAGSTSGPTW